MRIPLASALLLFVFVPVTRDASGSVDVTSDPVALMQMETRAEHADPREQCFLYTELVQVYTEVAGKQMAAGQMDEAGATLKHVEAFATRIHLNLTHDTKRLKNAEIMLSSASHRLGQYMHVVSSDDRAIVQSTLKQLDKVNDELLAQVFAH